MGIVTSSEKEHFGLIHRNSGLLQYFDFVIASGDYANSKPHPDPYLEAVRRSGVAPENCLVVEDSRRGLAAAVAAGLRCVVIPSSLTRTSEFPGAHRILNHIREVPPLLGFDAAPALHQRFQI
jgi:beta-phosphoglucomutase-like phosphatase (HAD superfamily)